MTSLNPPRDFYDPELLAAMEQAFDATWAVIQANEPALDRDRANELSIDISRKIVAFASEGVTDAVELRRLALEALPLLLPPQ
jgi:hypothetical protein